MAFAFRRRASTIVCASHRPRGTVVILHANAAALSAPFAAVMKFEIPFALKAGAGMLVFALAPAYCVWVLADSNKKGTLVKPDLARLEAKLKVDNPFAKEAPESALFFDSRGGKR